MTSEVSSSSSASSILNSYTKSNTALTKKTKQELEALNVDTSTIKTEADGETKLAAVKKNAALQVTSTTKEAAANATSTSTALSDDEAVEYVSSTDTNTDTE